MPTPPDPRQDPDAAAALRAALTEQLAYLIHEVEALRPIVALVPEPVQKGRPLADDLSLKETYGLFVQLDADVRLPRLRQMTMTKGDEAGGAPGSAPRFEAVDERSLARSGGWDERPMEAILSDVQAARRALVEAFAALPDAAWSRLAVFDDAERDVYAFAHHITQHDADTLRAIGYRLHESHLGARPR